MSKISVTALIEIVKPGRAKILVAPKPDVVAKYNVYTRRLDHVETGSILVCRMYFDTMTNKRNFRSFAAFHEGEGHSKFALVAMFRSEYADELTIQEEAFNKKLGSAVRAAFTASDETTATVETKPEPATSFGFADAFYVQEDEAKAFTMAKALAGTIPTKILVIGASGYGKTSLAKAFASKNGMDYVRFNTALVRDPEEFFGFRTVEDGDIKFVRSEFTKAIEAGNTVVVLDELNRATPEMANSLFPILDDAAETVVFGETIKVGPGTIIVATVNIGYQFVGTFSIDQALLNRMDITLRVSPLPADVETEVLVRRANVTKPQASKIVQVCNRLRDLTNSGRILVDASTRTSIRVAKFIAGGASYQDAFAWAVVNGAEEEERRAIIDVISGSGLD